MNTWVTSDHHFSHKNVITLCNRDFVNIDEHDQVLINTWNSVVQADDTVYHLGDFTLGNSRIAANVFRQLSGKIYVLTNIWHHDKRWLSVSEDCIYTKNSFIIFLGSIYIMSSNHTHIVLCHYPFEEWDKKHYGAIHFHGHSHGNLRSMKNRLDVGVDMAYKLTGQYRPFELSEAIKYADVVE